MDTSRHRCLYHLGNPVVAALHAFGDLLEGKAVLATEYDTKNMDAKCRRARDLRFSLIFKKLALDEWVRFC